MLSPTLVTLLAHAKEADSECTLVGIRTALAPLYHPDMVLADVVRVVMKAYEEALVEPRFELKTHGNATALLLAPIVGSCSIDPLGPPLTTTSYTVEQYYEAFLRWLIGQLALAITDWLPKGAVE